MSAIYEKDETLIEAGVYYNNDGSMKDIDFLNEPIPRHMMSELYVRNFMLKGNDRRQRKSKKAG